MSVTTPQLTGSGLVPTLPVYRFSVSEYHRMIETGVFAQNERVELLEGWVVPKMGHNPLHDATIQVAEDLLVRMLPSGWRVRIQSAITLDDSEPEPDLAIVPGPVNRYAKSHPRADEVVVAVEVADTTLTHDRTNKARLYARARIVCYWIINLIDRQVEVFTDPTGPVADPVYRQQPIFRESDSVPLVIEGQLVANIQVRDILP